MQRRVQAGEDELPDQLPLVSSEVQALFQDFHAPATPSILIPNKPRLVLSGVLYEKAPSFALLSYVATACPWDPDEPSRNTFDPKDHFREPAVTRNKNRLSSAAVSGTISGSQKFPKQAVGQFLRLAVYELMKPEARALVFIIQHHRPQQHDRGQHGPLFSDYSLALKALRRRPFGGIGNIGINSCEVFYFKLSDCLHSWVFS